MITTVRSYYGDSTSNRLTFHIHTVRRVNRKSENSMLGALCDFDLSSEVKRARWWAGMVIVANSWGFQLAHLIGSHGIYNVERAKKINKIWFEHCNQLPTTMRSSLRSHFTLQITFIHLLFYIQKNITINGCFLSSCDMNLKLNLVLACLFCVPRLSFHFLSFLQQKYCVSRERAASRRKIRNNWLSHCRQQETHLFLC